jgi:uncharacterized protein with von Willebrand factor type A (vWA) domain
MMPSSPIETVAAFGRYLRDSGYPVGLGEQAAMVRATLALTPAHYRKLEPCWRSIVCTNRDQWRRYPELFKLYWHRDVLGGATKVSDARRRSRSLREAITEMHDAMGGGQAASARAESGVLASGTPGDAQAADTGHAQGGASPVDPLERRGMQDWRPEDLARLRQLAEAVAKRVRRNLTRRVQLANRGRSLDLRRTMRRSLKYGGLPLAPAWQRRRRELPRVFILVDVSRSMELYAQLFLRVARAFCEVLGARVFVFHTRLAEVTPLLRRTSGRVQEKINAVSFGFGGGTRIATSLRDFADMHARAALTRRSIVLVCSDGYDTDTPEALFDSLSTITGRGARVYWLHPTRAAALSSALEGAQSLVTGFAPAHDLASLERIPALIH